MKKIVSFLLIAMVSVFLLSACSAAQGAANQFVELPSDVKAGITAVVLVAVSFVFAKLLTLIPQLEFLEPFREPIALAIAVELIRVIQVAVPDAYGTVAILALQLVLAVLAVFGFFNVLKERGVKGFK